MGFHYKKYTKYSFICPVFFLSSTYSVEDFSGTSSERNLKKKCTNVGSVDLYCESVTKDSSCKLLSLITNCSYLHLSLTFGKYFKELPNLGI